MADSARSAGHLARRPFLRQSIRSNYCAVYSVAMFLGRLGFNLTRRAAVALFDLRSRNPAYSGATLDEVVRRTRKATLGQLRIIGWRCADRSLPAMILREVELQAQSGLPTLLAFGARHKTLGLRANHMVVVTGLARGVISIVDPLGRAPSPCDSNAQLTLARSRMTVHGAPYEIDVSKRIAVFRWRKGATI